MNIESLLLEKLRGLPPDKQYEILDFAEFLHAKIKSIPPEKKREKFSPSKRILGLNKNENFWISDDFDAPLPDKFWLGEA